MNLESAAMVPKPKTRPDDTRERIMQIESKTLAKLRHPHRSPKLRDYLDTE